MIYPSEDQLKPWQARKFVPLDADLSDAESVARLYDALLTHFQDVGSSIEEIVLHHSELRAVLDQHEALQTVRFDVNTECESSRMRLESFNESVKPIIQRKEYEYQDAFLSAVPLVQLPDRLKLYGKQLESDWTSFREENIPLRTEIDDLGQEFRRISGSMTVVYRGDELALAQLNPLLRQPDRAAREEAWHLQAQCRMSDDEALSSVFSRLLNLRRQLADNAGEKDYVTYRLKEIYRFDYSPDDCKNYREAVESSVRPLKEELARRRAKSLGVTTLRPWDMVGDPAAGPALTPFTDEESLLEKSSRVFEEVDADVYELFREMRESRLLDLFSRKSKAPGGYCMTFSEARRSFIFMNLSGTETDLVGLFHEVGHTLHRHASAPEPLWSYRRPPVEFAEVASFGMELFCSEHWHVFYNEEESQRAIRRLLEESINILCGVAQYDAFQMWLYEGADREPAEWDDKWNELSDRYSGSAVSIEGVEREEASYWRTIPHLYLWPLYFIEYGIAKIGALQLWRQYKRDSESTLKRYQQALALGGSRPLPELFETAGIPFDFSESTIGPIVSLLREELEL